MYEDEAWAKDILKFKCFKDDKLIGNLYLDLFARPTKSSLSATHSVFDDKNIRNVIVTTNFSRNNISISQHHTLFHELGHAIHTLLTEHKLYYMASTRVEPDMLEVPSSFLEKISLHPEIIRMSTTHSVTGKIMSDVKISEFNRAMAIKDIHHVEYSAALSTLDVVFHSMPLKDYDEYAARVFTKYGFPADTQYKFVIILTVDMKH